MLGVIDIGSIVERLISWIVIGLITGGITVAVMRSQMKNLVSMVGGLADAVADHERQIAEIRNERTGCELRAAQTYATRAEIARLISDQTTQHSQVMSKLDELSGTMHGRVTEVAKQVSNIQGKIGQGATNDGRPNTA